jgi:hypothetical protein
LCFDVFVVRFFIRVLALLASLAVAIPVRLSLCLCVLVVNPGPPSILSNDDEGRALDYVRHAQAGSDTLYHRGLACAEVTIESHDVARSEL